MPMMRVLGGNRRRLMLLLLIPVFLASRLVFLESDIPEWEVTLYSPIDELYYTQVAFEMVHPTKTLAGFDIHDDLLAINLAETYVTALSLKLVGDTYYGVRLPSVVAGAIAFFLFTWFFLGRFGAAAGGLGGLFLLADPGFILSNRVAEPTIFRLAAATVVIAYVIRVVRGGRALDPIAMGFISTAGWLFVYPTNAFLMLAGLLVCVAFPTTDRWPKLLLKFVFGGAAAAAVWALLLIALLPVPSLLEGFKYTFGNSSHRVAPSSAIHGVHLPFFVYNLVTIGAANFFRLNKYFLLLSFAAFLVLAASLVKAGRRRDAGGIKALWGRAATIDKVMLIYGGSFLAQTLFVNDFPYRKLVFGLPFLVYFILLACESAVLIFARVKRARLIVLATVVPAVLLAAAVSYRLIYKNPQYFYVSAMRRLQALDGEYVVGGGSLAFRLYNNYQTYLNGYQYLREPNRKAIYEAHLAAIAKLPRDVYVIDYEMPGKKEFYGKLGYVKVAKVMEINDPSNVDAPVVLYKNVR